MKTKSALCAFLIGAPALAGAITTFDFEQDNADGVKLRIIGATQASQVWGDLGNIFRDINSPSGLWSFHVFLSADVRDEAEVNGPSIAMWLSSSLWETALGIESGMGTHPFAEYLPINSPTLFVQENNWDFRPEKFESWRGENWFRIDSRPSLLDPATWNWTFYSSLVNPEPVPETGSLLIPIALILLGAFWMTRGTYCERP